VKNLEAAEVVVAAMRTIHLLHMKVVTGQLRASPLAEEHVTHFLKGAPY
jgi:hypothetical protein